MNELEPYKPAAPSPAVVRFDADRRQSGDRTDRINFALLFAAIQRRMWLFLGVAGGIFLAALAVTLISTPTFTATSRIVINNQQVQVAPTTVSGTANAPVVSSVPDQSSAIDTEVAAISSRRVAQRVVDMLHLDRDPEFSLLDAPKHLGRLGKLKLAIGGFLAHLGPQRVAPPASPEDYTVSAVLNSLTVERYNLTNAIDISFDDFDPQKAAAIANAFAQAYLDDQIASKFSSSTQANTFLQARLAEMQKQYLDDNARLQEYKIAHNLMSSGSTTLTEQEISTYNQSVAQAKAEAAADEASLRTARDQLAHGSTGEDVGEALNSGVVQSLRAQRATLSEHVADLQGRYGDKYPELLVARRQLADVDAQIQAEINRVISNLEAKAQVSRQRLASIEGTLSATKGALAENNQSEVGLDQLQQAANASEALYQSYLNRLKETAAQQGGELADAKISSLAPVPSAPTRPKVLLNLALGVLLGLAGGTVATFVAELLYSGLTTADDIETRFGHRYLAGIPLLASVHAPKGLSPLSAVVEAPLSAYAEAFRNLKTSIDYTLTGGSPHPQLVMITSALPREGKTTASIGLARTAALQGTNTLLVDCDLRRRGVGQIVAERSDQPGLIEVLRGTAKLSEALVLDPLSGAMLLPLHFTKTPMEDLFSSEKMDALIDLIRKQFDLVIFDTPPLLAVVDARVIASKVDAVVLITRWQRTEAGAVQSALRLLPAETLGRTGIALSQIDMKKQSKYGYGDPGFYYKEYKDYYA